MLIGGGFYIANLEAWKSNSDLKLAAIIVRGGTVVSTGHNFIETHPAAYFGCSFHAEHNAIRKARGSIVGAKMFVYRFSRFDNTIRVSRPCKLCQNEIAKAELGNVIYVDEFGDICKESFVYSDRPSPHMRHLYMDSAYEARPASM